MISPKHTGRKYPAAEDSRYTVELEDIRKFTRAVGDLNPFYHEEESASTRSRGAVAPPMFAVRYQRGTVNRFLNDPDLAIDMAKLVHWEQEFDFPELVKPGDMLESEGEILEIVGKRGLDLINLAITTFNQHRRVVCRAKWIIFIRQ